MIDATNEGWVFSRRFDLTVFGGSALLSFALLLVGNRVVGPAGETPTWAWVSAVLLVDVAHVWATGFRVYFDRVELARRPWLYFGTPLVSYLILARVYAAGPEWFWRGLAYLAIFHFVRQQGGWLALARARSGDRRKATRVVDDAAIYAATLYPLVFWHTHPRRFDWFTPGELLRLPEWTERAAFPLYVVALGVYAARSLYRIAHRRPWSPGKDLVVVTTAACWYVGIVASNSDYAFTVTNVFIHGIPYVGLVYAYGAAQPKQTWRSRLAPIVTTIWALAYAEELLWDRGVWGERPSLFGATWHLDAGRAALIPLLAVPQVTHYLLDGFIWRRADNPGLGVFLGRLRSSRRFVDSDDRRDTIDFGRP